MDSPLPKPPRMLVVFSAVVLNTDSVFWNLREKETMNIYFYAEPVPSERRVRGRWWFALVLENDLKPMIPHHAFTRKLKPSRGDGTDSISIPSTSNIASSRIVRKLKNYFQSGAPIGSVSLSNFSLSIIASSNLSDLFTYKHWKNLFLTKKNVNLPKKLLAPDFQIKFYQSE